MSPATPSNIVGTWREQTPQCSSTITFAADNRITVLTGGNRSIGAFKIADDDYKGSPVSKLEITFENGTSPENGCTGTKQVVRGEKYIAYVWISSDTSRMEMQPQYLPSKFTFVRE